MLLGNEGFGNEGSYEGQNCRVQVVPCGLLSLNTSDAGLGAPLWGVGLPGDMQGALRHPRTVLTGSQRSTPPTLCQSKRTSDIAHVPCRTRSPLTDKHIEGNTMSSAFYTIASKPFFPKT